MTVTENKAIVHEKAEMARTMLILIESAVKSDRVIMKRGIRILMEDLHDIVLDLDEAVSEWQKG